MDAALVEKTYRMEDRGRPAPFAGTGGTDPAGPPPARQRELLARIQAAVRQPLNESLLITLADHISFAIRRKEQGIEFKNPLGGQYFVLLSH